jgi:uncharacterized protein (TIGR03435 family)
MSMNAQGRLSISNMTVLRLIVNAYNLGQTAYVEGGPAWIGSERWDIEATPAEQAPFTPSQLQQFRGELLKAILRDRFHLAAHDQTRQVPIFVLTADKNVKIKRSADQGPIVLDASRPADGSVGRGGTRTNAGSMTARAIEIGRLARNLAGQVGRPVEDHTGLTGLYDIDLKWTPESLQAGTDSAANSDTGSLFTAIKEQLGLKLSSGTGPTQVVVVDRVERPGEN